MKKLIQRVKARPVITAFIIMMMLAMGGVGIWSMRSASHAEIDIDSLGGQVGFTVDFSAESLDVTDGPGSVTSTASIANSNSALDAVLNYNITKDDVIDDCTDSDDCVVTVKQEGTPVSDGETISIPSGTSTLEVVADCVQLACPQQISADVAITNLNVHSDTTDPTGSITTLSPQDATTYDNGLEGTADDETALDTVTVSVWDGAAYIFEDEAVSLSGSDWTLDTTALWTPVNGVTYDVELTVTDTSANSVLVSESIVFELGDITPPTVTLTDDGASFSCGEYYDEVRGTITDTESGVNYVEVRVEKGGVEKMAWTTATITGDDFVVGFTNYVCGDSLDIEIRGFDLAGNEAFITGSIIM